MRLTARCIDIFRLLAGSRWLTTGQIHRRFFAGASLDAARKRLRKLTTDEYLVVARESRMDEALFTLGRTGKRVLEAGGAGPIVLERQPPVQREHFLAVNDIRIAAELTGSLGYFFAYWELPGISWRHSIIPDSVLRMADRTYAVEFDRGLEGIQYFVKTKIAAYRRGFAGLPLSAILIVTDRNARMAALSKAIGDSSGRVLFSTLSEIRARDFSHPIFHREPGDGGVRLVDNGLFSDSLHEKRRIRGTTHLEPESWEAEQAPLLKGKGKE